MKPKSARSAMWGRKFLTVCALFASATLLFGAPHSRRKISLDLENKTGTVDVIVQFKQLLSAAMNQKVYLHGGLLRRQLRGVRGGSYCIPASALAQLANDPDVAYISLDR